MPRRLRPGFNVFFTALVRQIAKTTRLLRPEFFTKRRFLQNRFTNPGPRAYHKTRQRRQSSLQEGVLTPLSFFISQIGRYRHENTRQPGPLLPAIRARQLRHRRRCGHSRPQEPPNGDGRADHRGASGAPRGQGRRGQDRRRCGHPHPGAPQILLQGVRRAGHLHRRRAGIRRGHVLSAPERAGPPSGSEDVRGHRGKRRPGISGLADGTGAALGAGPPGAGLHAGDLPGLCEKAGGRARGPCL